ncbi:MAG TPA: DUF262 domain-containing protein [Bacteroidia bacterium]|jgi:hypothetical protein|nr:DUF262 domain-containing protein [Bacteroidia bacterium]
MPKQDITVGQLKDKVLSGELTLPEMQRRYVWTGVKVRDLLDSLYRGYPSGTILVWETDIIQNDRELQIQDAVKTTLSSKLLLLDGQQRLTSLTAILSGNPVMVRNKKRPIDIMFNLDHPDTFLEEMTVVENEEEFDDDEDDNDEDENDILEELRKRTFVVASRSLKNDPNWVSVTDIFKKTDSQILKPLNINSDDARWDKFSERIKKVRRIEDYNYVMQILDKKMSYEEVTEIFVRVNSLGVKLRGSDLALAQITSRWTGFMHELEKFAAEFDNNEEYLHETGIMIKSLVAFATNQSKYKTVGRVPLESFKLSWEKAKTGLRYAINFLNSNVRIENLRLLSSPFLLLPIAYYAIQKNERITDEEVKKILLWFYTAHMKGRYSKGSSESILDSDLSVLNKTQSLDELLNSLRLQVKDFTVTAEEVKTKNRRSPYFSMLFFIYKQKAVKDWFTGIAISEKLTGRSHALQFHHIYPKSLLRDLNYDRREINEISNLAFIVGKTNRTISNKEPKVYMTKILQERGKEVFTSQNIPHDPTLWELSSYRQFLEYCMSSK